jgi:hypothetical protein
MFLKMLIGLLTIFILCACGAADADHNARAAEPALNDGKSARQQPAPFVPDEVIVCFSPQTDKAFIKNTAARLNLTIIKVFKTPGLFLMRITDASPVEMMIKRLKKVAAVTCAEPNYTVSTSDAAIR